MGSATSASRGPVVLAFAGAVLIGGANFVAVKFSNEGLPPLFGAALRFASASLLFFVLAGVRRAPFPRGRAALGAALYGVFGFGLAYALLYLALVGLSPGLTSVIVAAVPLVTLALAVAHGQERFSLQGVIGGVLAVAGIATLSARVVGGEVGLVYLGAAILAVFAIGESAVIVKGFPRGHPLMTNGIGMASGTVVLVVGSIFREETWALPEMPQTWLALAWLIVVGSVGLFALFLFVIARWTASASSYALALMPMVAVTLGVLLADEEVTWELIVGGALVLTAVYVGALRQERPMPPAAEGASSVAAGAAAAPTTE